MRWKEGEEGEVMTVNQDEEEEKEEMVGHDLWCCSLSASTWDLPD